MWRGEESLFPQQEEDERKASTDVTPPLPLSRRLRVNKTARRKDDFIVIVCFEYECLWFNRWLWEHRGGTDKREEKRMGASGFGLTGHCQVSSCSSSVSPFVRFGWDDWFLRIKWAGDGWGSRMGEEKRERKYEAWTYGCLYRGTPMQLVPTSTITSCRKDCSSLFYRIVVRALLRPEIGDFKKMKLSDCLKFLLHSSNKLFWTAKYNISVDIKLSISLMVVLGI